MKINTTKGEIEKLEKKRNLGLLDNNLHLGLLVVETLKQFQLFA
jgi:hypothetical protein